MKKKVLLSILSMMFFIVTGLQPVISDRFTLSGAIELDYAYTGDSDLSDNTNNQFSSDLDIGTVELGLEAVLHEYVSANFLLKGEALDSDDKIFWDEAFFTIQKQGVHAYFIGGKRGQPFGLNRLKLIFQQPSIKGKLL
ncbi:MAG: hypothetical protein JRC91_11910 [Deltaproteobacteria bacterium]|nr:hypothetical protein [Deltaproteobacteria bacterium]